MSEMDQEEMRDDAQAAWMHYEATGLCVTSEEADAWLDKLQAGKMLGRLCVTSSLVIIV